MTAPVLAEALGPRATRQVRVVSVLVFGALAVVAVLAWRRLAEKGQLDADLWRPLTEASVVRFILGGLGNTARAGAVAIGLSLTSGLLLALARLSPRRLVLWSAGAYIEFFRSVPLVLLVLFCAVGLPVYGLDLGPFWSLVVALSVYNGAVLAEIFRAGVLALDKGQSEAAAAIGLGYWGALLLVVLPQALRRMVPAIISQLVTLLKDTSLGAVVPYEELLRRGRITGEYYRNPLQALFVVAVVYIVVNFTLGRVVGRFGAVRRVEPADTAVVAAAVEAGIPLGKDTSFSKDTPLSEGGGWRRWRRPSRRRSS